MAYRMTNIFPPQPFIKVALKVTSTALLILCGTIWPASGQAEEKPPAFFQAHCYGCHDTASKQGGLDLSALQRELSSGDNFLQWMKIHDRIESGEMPPKGQARPSDVERAAIVSELKGALIGAEREKRVADPRTGVRRMTRAEYENTIRDLFDMPGIALQNELPADGSAHGFDKNSDALDISHVNLAKYIEAAEQTLKLAIAIQPQPPTVKTQRISLANTRRALSRTFL